MPAVLRLLRLLNCSCCARCPRLPRSTNASYGRWDEARKMWGSMVNRTRDLARMVRTD
jgi:hypothetical protein